MEIRQATKDDAQAIHDLHTRSVRALCSSVYSKGIIDGWLEGRNPEGYKGIANGEMYVIERDGQVAAWSHVRATGLVAIFVDPDHAGQGLGRRLMEHADRLVQSFGNRMTYIGATFNAVGFYEKFGFVETGRDVIQKGQVSVPMVHMTRKIDSQQSTEGDGLKPGP